MSPVTRTVAIIKHHALHHRFDIEPRIQEASFEVRFELCRTARCFIAFASDREGATDRVRRRDRPGCAV